MPLVSLLLLLATSSPGLAQSKPIRLRNGVIDTSEPSPRVRTQNPAFGAGEFVVSGHFLIQFRDRLQPGWEQALQAEGVKLVRFVPEDAFVAYLRQSQLDRIRQLPFVRYVSQYRREQKVHQRLLDWLSTGVRTESIAIALLLSPEAGAEEARKAAGQFQSLLEQSRTSLGLILRGRVAHDGLERLASTDAVLWIEPGPRRKLLDEISSKIVAGAAMIGSGGSEGHDREQTRRDQSANREDPLPFDFEHATTMQQLGFDGQGVAVAVVDSGLNNGEADTMHPDLVGRVSAFLSYGSLPDASDPNGHGTHIAGIIAGNAATGEADGSGALYGLGIAPRAQIVVQRVFDRDGQDQLPGYGTLTRDAVRAGAFIASNSWGDDVQGRYDLSAAQVDALVRDADPDTPGDQPMVLGFSAGNAGPGRQSIDSPAVAKNVIAIGASENDRLDMGLYTQGQGAMADFSSRGPAEDGRIKPDLVAPGTWIASLRSAAAGDENAWAPISANYQFQGGTSQAVPHVTGAAAVFVQYFRDMHHGVLPSPALVKAALINGAASLTRTQEVQSVPDGNQGWGRVALTNFVNPARAFEYFDQGTLLATGQAEERHVVVASSSEPLKFTLVYTDAPGLPAALPALVNDLDLEVVAPDGRIYRGNQFADGESIDNVAASDNVNNVEAVHLRSPLAGEYLVRVTARNVVQDVHQRAAGAPQQDYALVISGDLPSAGTGVLVLDRGSYTAPGLIQLKLLDSDLAGQPSVTVLVRSSSAPVGEQVILRPASSSGVFTGAVVTVTGPKVSDGQLQLQQGDQIDAFYQDASPAGVRTAHARANLAPPTIRNVALTNRFGKEIVSWQTDTPSTTALFSQSGPQGLFVTNSTLVAEHEVVLNNLSAGVRYTFLVGSTDEAGNSAVNDNQGQLFSFVATVTPAVLLVNAYVPDDPIAGTTPVPLSSYTGPLDQSGFTYAVWDLTQPDSRSPGPADLSAFRAVIWRLSDSYASKATLSPDQQNALTAYVSGGGSLLIASMELLSRLGPVPFRTNVLQVQGLTPNPQHGLAQCPTCDEDHGVEKVVGADHDVITDGIETTLDYTNYNSDVLASVGIPSDMADTFETSAAALPILFEPDSGKTVGIRYPRTGKDTAGRVVFLSLPFDALPEAVRTVFMGNVLRFLAPDSSELASISLDRSAYTIPDLVTVEVADAGMAGRRQVTAQLFTSSQTNGVSIVLAETGRAGVFRGFVTVTSPNEAMGPARLAAAAKDLVWAEYFDPSIGRLVRADADIDVNGPQIAGLTAQSAYVEATVSWTTSESTDALVQFGESSFLGRTAYLSDLARQHRLTLTGLKPDRVYLFQVVSRDSAGNAVVDDNAGKLHSFRTLKPVFAPWSDSLEVPNTNWTVSADPGSDIQWSRGVPQNGRETQAHSPTQAWGSDLQAASISFTHTLLTSPPVDLPGGQFATLRFWQSYDVQSDSGLESGRLLILTNAQPGEGVLLDQLDGANAGWEEAVYDLSGYAGRVIQIVWEYDFASLDAPEARPGWLIDDVSITVTNALTGSIQVSNNLAQASFTLAGPISRSGQGWKTSFTNAPPGQYVVQFADVPYFQTPPPQTNTLSDGGLVFEGKYQLEDVNQNGLADSWESQFFGALLTGDPARRDSDKDGLSDYAEFMAGTDPTDPASVLSLAPPVRMANGMCRLTWAAVTGHAYRVLCSNDARTWVPRSSWIRAGTTQLSYTVSVQNAPAAYFRLEVSP